ncbi:hypothetical protein SALBM135S_10157 [Streptomyces alboniger]
MTFWMTFRSSTPTSDPLMKPKPPVSRVPPMTTAEIASSSMPEPRMVTPETSHAALSAPARPAQSPERV